VTDQNNQAYIRNNEIETATMGEEIGMLNVETGKYYILDPIATDIWQALEKPMTVTHLVLHLTQIYEVDQETCFKETEIFLSELIENKLVKPL
jgi:hypothetical protein